MRICAGVFGFVLLTMGSAFAKEYLFIHNTYSGEVSKISIPEHEVVQTIEIGYYMDYLAASPDGRVVYVNRIEGDLPGSRARNVGVSGEIFAFDSDSGETLWKMSVDGMPHHIAVSKDGKRMFVPYYNDWWVAVFDLEARELVKKIWVGNGTHGTKLSADGQRLYVGSMMNDTLTVIDTESLEVANVFGFRDGVRPFAFPKDESVIYVQQSWLHGFVILDPETREKTTFHLPDHETISPPDFYPHNVNHGIALTPDEKLLFVNGSALNYVAVYTHPNLDFVKTIPVGTDPNSIAFSGDGRFAYVSNRRSDDVSVIDVEKLEEVNRIPLGKYPQRMVVVDVPE